MFTTRPELSGSFGVVSSTHWIASAVAFGVLEQGGNAFDAAVAGGFTLHAVEPHLNGAGGDMSLLFYAADVGRPQALCGQGPAPAGATMWTNSSIFAISFSMASAYSIWSSPARRLAL